MVALTTGCGGQENNAEGLKQPPTAGVPTVGPGSGEVLASHLHYTVQKNEPETKFADASCPDVPESKPGATVTCQMSVDGNKQKFKLRMDDDGIWQMIDR
jgi:hypothetical protein